MPSKVTVINERLLNIKPPQKIYRSPRSLNDRRKWKAAEWRSWLLFYSFPCLEGIFKSELLESFLLFIRSIHILLQPTISENNLKACEIDLIQFVGECQVYYGKAAITFNIHSALHVCHSVLQVGPLWATSAFPYESNIYVLKNEVSSPKSVDEQMATRYLKRMAYEHYIAKVGVSEKCSEFCVEIVSTRKHYTSNVLKTLNGALFAGSKPKIENTYKYMSLILSSKDYSVFKNSTQVHVYERCIFRGTILHTAKYSEAIQTNDSVVKLDDGTIVKILSYLIVSKLCFILYKELITMPLDYNNLRVNNIVQITGEAQDEQIIAIERIGEKLVVVNIQCKQFLCTMPNTFENL